MHWLPLKVTPLLKIDVALLLFYGISEVQTESGIENKLYQVQEGTEYLNENQTDNYVNSNYYYEFVSQYDRLFADKHQVGGLIVFNFSESLNTISGGLLLQISPQEIWVCLRRATYGYDDRYFVEQTLDTMDLKSLREQSIWFFSFCWRGLDYF